MSDASSLGITPASGATSLLNLVYNSVFPSQQNAAQLGNLTQNSTDINVLSQLTSNVSTDYYQFNFTSGSALKLSFNAITGLADGTQDNPAGSTQDGTSAGLRFQVLNSAGNVVADSGGTPAQQAAYASLTSSGGLSAATGTYYVKVSAANGATINADQSYNFQLYSGSTYNTSLTYTAQTQPFDPNLFNSASSTVTAASNLNTYLDTATLSGTQGAALNIGQLDDNQTSLFASSTVNGLNQSSYYTFNFDSGTAIKFGITNNTDASTRQTLRVQLYDSKGALVADSAGTQAQQEAYQQLDSGEGLNAANGQYSVKVSYAPNSLVSSAQNYTFQLYSGNTYNTFYNTTANLPTTTSTVGQYGENIGVFANQNAQLFSRSEYHAIGETAQSGPNIGWISANKAASNVVSQLSNVDSVDYYNFTLQQGDNLKLQLNNQSNNTTRIQILDPSGSFVIADNYGTAAQQKAFTNLTSSSGLAAKPGNYAIRVSYPPGVTPPQKAETYDFQIYSGDSYTNLYKFTASAQTYQNAVLSGNTNVAGYNPLSATTSFLTGIASGQPTVDILGDLSKFA